MTPEFRRWFGDSKVVDENGEPLVVYHGGFDALGSEQGELKPGVGGRFGAGIYLAPDKSTAEAYAGPHGSAVTALFVRIEKPLLVYAGGTSTEAALLDALAPFSSRSRGQMLRELRHDQDRSRTLDRYRSPVYLDSVERLVREAGFDGIFVTNHSRGAAPKERYFDRVRHFISEIVVFDPKQLKSATANVGTYDPEDSDMRRNPAYTAYHGTQRYFDKPTSFDKLRAIDFGPGFYFALDPVDAASYGPHVYRAQVRVDHPIVVSNEQIDDEFVRRFSRALGASADDIRIGTEHGTHPIATLFELARTLIDVGTLTYASLRKYLMKLGYDGVVVDSDVANAAWATSDSSRRMRGQYVVVFSPEQILSWELMPTAEPAISRNPLLAKPPTAVHRLTNTASFRRLFGRLPRNSDYEGVHTTGSRLIAGAYAMGTWDSGDGYPVIVTLDVSGLKPLPDVDAMLRGAEAVADLLGQYRTEVKAGATFYSLLNEDDFAQSEVSVGEEPAAFIFEDVGAHVLTAIDEEQDPEAVFEQFLKSGKLPDSVLTRMVDQQRYLNDFDIDRVVRVEALRPWWHQVLFASDDAEDDDKVAALEARGYTVFTLEDWPFHDPGETRTLWEAPDAKKRKDVEYHGTTSLVIELAFPGLIPEETPFPIIDEDE
jgi:hypothetical protein